MKNINLKNVAIIAGLFIAGSALLAINKVKGLASIFDHMTIKPNSFPKQVKTTLTSITFNIDIRISNPTKEPFAVSGYIATLKRIDVFYKDNFIGSADLLLDEISVPANGHTILRDVRIAVAPAVLLQNIMTLAQQLTTSMNLNDLKFIGVIDVLGTEYIVNN